MLRSIWILPDPGMEPVSPALADSLPLRHQGIFLSDVLLVYYAPSTVAGMKQMFNNN